jgi:hypothetical protein
MLDSTSSIAALATQMSAQNTSQQAQVDVLKKAQNVQDQQGLDALQLIASSKTPTTGVDLYA